MKRYALTSPWEQIDRGGTDIHAILIAWIRLTLCFDLNRFPEALAPHASTQVRKDCMKISNSKNCTAVITLCQSKIGIPSMPSPNVFITFCEPTHIRSAVIAEFWNTISSFCYCLPAIYFWILTNRFRSALPECFTPGVVWRYKLCAFCWIMLGFGSAAFHAFQTLWAEMWDEIGMLFSILSLSYCLIDLQ